MAVNLLLEYLPSSLLSTLFSFVPDLPPKFDINDLVRSGWEPSLDTLCDTPDVFVENILPIRNQPSLIITVGLPGSGKSTWAKLRLGKERACDGIAADDYFDKFNDGKFDPSLLGQAHEWCRTEVEKALMAGRSVVAANTNTTLQEMHAYVTKVVFGGLPHKIVFAVMPERNIDVLTKRGLHNVPPKSCKDMLKRMALWMKRGPPTIRGVLRAGKFSGRRPDPSRLAKEVIFTGIF